MEDQINTVELTAADRVAEAKTNLENVQAELKRSTATLKVAKTYADAMAKVAKAAPDNVESQAEVLTSVATHQGWQDAVDALKVAVVSAKAMLVKAQADLKAENKAAAPVKAVVARDEKNGQRRPTVGTSSDKLWAVYDSVANTKGSAPALEDVLALARETGIVDGTIKAAYAHWRKYHGVTGRVVSDARQSKVDADAKDAADKVAAKAAAKAAPAPAAPAPSGADQSVAA